MIQARHITQERISSRTIRALDLDFPQHPCGGGVVQLTHYVNGHSAGVPTHDDLVNAWIAASVRMTACGPVPSSASGWHTDSGVSTF